ncbi:MAG: DedA family protein [Dehalococcoidia bacterium]|nr:DedA family protein [Dehalococcoidia bacterium]
MELVAQVAEELFRVVETSAAIYALLAVFVWVTLEEAGVPLIPTADMVLLVAGWRTLQGDLNPLALVLTVVVATVLGSSALYWVSLRGGHPFVVKYGKILGVTPDRLDRAERWVQRRRAPALVAGRMAPGFKTVVSIAAGIFEVDYRTFAVLTALAATVWATSSVTIGRVFGPHVAGVAELALRNPVVVGGVVAVALTCAALVYLRRRRRRPVTGGDARNAEPV